MVYMLVVIVVLETSAFVETFRFTMCFANHDLGISPNATRFGIVYRILLLRSGFTIHAVLYLVRPEQNLKIPRVDLNSRFILIDTRNNNM